MHECRVAIPATTTTRPPRACASRGLIWAGCSAAASHPPRYARLCNLRIGRLCAPNAAVNPRNAASGRRLPSRAAAHRRGGRTCEERRKSFGHGRTRTEKSASKRMRREYIRKDRRKSDDRTGVGG
eukprot:458879-Pleurochrysis_carterae.AAC.1